MIDTNIELGDYVVNSVTNTEGYVTAIADHLTGCTRVGTRAHSEDTTETHDLEFYYPSTLRQREAPSAIQALADASTPNDPRIEPGHIVEDELTGGRGLATVVTYRSFNCPQACVCPETDEGYATDGEFIDAPRLEVIGDECVGTYEDTDDGDDDPQSTGAIGESVGDEQLIAER